MTFRVARSLTPYARGVRERNLWRDGEERVITVTPVSRGVWRPFLVTATTFAIIVEAAGRYHVLHRFEPWLVVLTVAPLLLVTVTRAWRWRSHKIRVSSERVILEGGTLQRTRTSIELRDVFATRIEQRIIDRFARRGVVVLDTVAGSMRVGEVRHPGALCRLIDAERYAQTLDVPFGTVFSYDGPQNAPYTVRAEGWTRRRYE